MSLFKTFALFFSPGRLRLIVLGILGSMTAGTLAETTPPAPTINARLSQTKLIKDEIHTVYLDVNIKSPSIPSEQSAKRASDIVVVLDNSGSMSEANKLTFAKEAIHDLLSRLNENDRFALITFSDDAAVNSPFVAVTADMRRRLNESVNRIEVAGGTNMGQGLKSASKLLAQTRRSSVNTVFLLSDGHANQGITDIPGLSRIVTEMTGKQAVVSTIGMGLDFNETLLSALADHGMGRYAYLENLAGLGAIFAQNLDATRAVYAAMSTLTVAAADGVELVEAGGYPIEREGKTYRIKTGQLLGDGEKRFVMTFNVKAGQTGNLSLGQMHLDYQPDSKDLRIAVAPEQLSVAVLPLERRQESVASINGEVYRQTWTANNLGVIKKEVSRWIREGNKDKAEEAIEAYRREVSNAEKAAGVPLASPELEQKIGAMRSSIADAFTGDHAEQQIKQKRAAKSLQSSSLKEQRADSKAQQ